MATTNNGFYVPQGLWFGDGTTQTSAYGNANVVTLLTNYGSNTISTSGNIDAGSFNGNGVGLTGLKWANITGANANVAAYLASNATININIGTGSFSTQGTVTAESVTGTTVTASNVSKGFYGEGSNISNIQWVNIVNADQNVKNYLESNATINITVGAGDFLTQGTITTSYADGFHGEGGNISNIQWANIPGANAIVANVLSSGSNIANISATGNIDSGNVSANGNVVSGNVNTGNVSSTGNVDSSNVNSNVVSLGPGNLLLNGNNIYSTGDITIDPQWDTATPGEYGNVYIAGNLHVQNTLTYIDTTISVINALEYVAADGAVSAAAANSAGLVIGNVGVGAGRITSWTYDNPANSWTTDINISLAGNVAGGNLVANYLWGDGSNITNINASSLVGAYSNGNVSNYLADFGSNVISTTGNITATNFIGNGVLLSNIAGANVSGIVPNASHVTSPAQGNITSVGILTAVNTSGVVSATGNINTAASVNANTGSVIGATVVGDTVIGDSVQYGNLVSNVGRAVTQVYNLIVPAGGANSISLTNVKAVDYSWVMESTDDDSVSMGKSFVVANSSDASQTNYSLAQVGANTVMGIDLDTGSTSSAVVIGVITNTLGFNANLVITTTQFA